MASFEITRKNGDVYTVLVDDEDLERVLAAGPWHIHLSLDGQTYVRKSKPRPRRGVLLLHRFLLGAEGKEQVDHRDGSGLNNQRQNLRRCTNALNGRNQKLRKCSRSGLKGVHFCKRTERWRALIMLGGKSIHLGRFDTPEEAHAAYCRASERYHGEFGRTG